MRITAIAAAVLLLATAAPASASAPSTAGRPAITADVNGRAIAPTQIPQYFCHDHDYPRIHCFTTSMALEAAVSSSAATMQATSSSDYVVVYAGTNYYSSYMYVSQNYDALAVVGWNDRIRSYRALNGYPGVFYTDWFGSGAVLDFCCNNTAPYLSSTFDSQISSVYRR